MQQRLMPIGPVNVVEAIVNGRKFYRVRIGPLPGVSQADDVLQKAKSAGADNVRTVVD
ncbi:MAG: SPOR domain-containing protein [Pseudomonadota bacterium]|nr:SPOR domain-containing protein [Pseudomonadota bacterium]